MDNLIKKRVIGIDLDTTLVMLNAVVRASSELGYEFREQDAKEWNHINFPDDLRERIFQLFHDAGFMNSVEPIEGAPEKVREWAAAGHEIHLVTARVEGIRDGTVEMVRRLFPEIGNIDFVDMHQSKLPLLVAKGVDVWIDDAVHGVQDALSAGIETYLISNKYTQYNWRARDLPGVKVVKYVGEIEL